MRCGVEVHQSGLNAITCILSPFMDVSDLMARLVNLTEQLKKKVIVKTSYEKQVEDI